MVLVWLDPAFRITKFEFEDESEFAGTTSADEGETAEETELTFGIETTGSLTVVSDNTSDGEGDVISNGPPDDGRILYFPDHHGERALDDYKSEMLDTLQAMRDQMQQMTERLFSQERETAKLRKKLAEAREDGETGQKGPDRQSGR